MPIDPATLSVNSAARFHCSPDWRWDTGPQGFGDFDLWVVVDRRGRLRTPEHTFQVSRGDAFVLRPRTHYVGQHDPHRPLHVVGVHFSIASAPASAAGPTSVTHR